MTAYGFQVVVDAAAPHELADWWAAALGWDVEPSDEAFIRKMIAEGYASEADTTEHRGVLVWREGAAIRPPAAAAEAGPAAGAGYSRVLFQLVPEAKTVKNRVHLDLRTGDEQEAVVARLVAAGATQLHRGQQGPHHWVTLADPEGNEFCVA
jgi:Glyoxalase-like domain